MKPKLIYQFTPQEKRLIESLYLNYLSAMKVIAEMHSIPLPVSIAPDGTGFLAPSVGSEAGAAEEPPGPGKEG